MNDIKYHIIIFINGAGNKHLHCMQERYLKNSPKRIGLTYFGLALKKYRTLT